MGQELELPRPTLTEITKFTADINPMKDVSFSEKTQMRQNQRRLQTIENQRSQFP